MPEGTPQRAKASTNPSQQLLRSLNPAAQDNLVRYFNNMPGVSQGALLI